MPSTPIRPTHAGAPAPADTLRAAQIPLPRSRRGSAQSAASVRQARAQATEFAAASYASSSSGSSDGTAAPLLSRSADATLQHVTHGVGGPEAAGLPSLQRPATPSVTSRATSAGPNSPTPLYPLGIAPTTVVPSLRSLSLSSAGQQSVHTAPSSIASSGSESDGQLETKIKTYLRAGQTLVEASKWGRKAMPMIMHAGALGVMVAAFVTLVPLSPLFLIAAPIIFFPAGAALSAPAGWAVAKLLQWRMLGKPENARALTELKLLAQQDDFATVRRLAAAQRLSGKDVGSDSAFLLSNNALLLDDKTIAEAVKDIDAALAFAEGRNVFKDGFKRSFTGPFKWFSRSSKTTFDELGLTTPGYNFQQQAAKVRPLATSSRTSSTVDEKDEKSVFFDADDELAVETDTQASLPLSAENLAKLQRKLSRGE